MIRIWGAETDAVVGRSLIENTLYMESVAHSPDLWSGNKTIRIWDSEICAASGKPPEAHINGVQSVTGKDTYLESSGSSRVA